LKDLLIFLQRSSIGKTLESGSTSTREKLADFSAQTYGVRAGGAITKINYFISLITKDKIMLRQPLISKII
jgi:hypothetical protein